MGVNNPPTMWVELGRANEFASNFVNPYELIEDHDKKIIIPKVVKMLPSYNSIYYGKALSIAFITFAPGVERTASVKVVTEWSEPNKKHQKRTKEFTISIPRAFEKGVY